MDDYRQLVTRLILQVKSACSIITCNNWLQECDDCVKSLINFLNDNSSKLTVGQKKVITGWFVKLKGSKVRIKLKLGKLTKLGTGLSTPHASTSKTSGGKKKSPPTYNKNPPYQDSSEESTTASSSDNEEAEGKEEEMEETEEEEEEEGGTEEDLYWEDIETAFRCRIATRAIINVKHIEPRKFLMDAKKMIIEYLKSLILEHNSIKVNTLLSAEFIAGEVEDVKTFGAPNRELFQCTDLSAWFIEHVCEPILTAMEEFQERDSGWALLRITDLLINVNKYNPYRAGCQIIIPNEILLKHATINVQSRDEDACFYWSIVAGIRPARRNVSRSSSYPHYSTLLCLDDLPMPMTLDKMKHFEKINNISVNVFFWTKGGGEKDQEECLPLKLTTAKRNHHVNLLMLEDSQNESSFHFILIRDLAKLVGSQLSKHEHKKKICDR